MKTGCNSVVFIRTYIKDSSQSNKLRKRNIQGLEIKLPVFMDNKAVQTQDPRGFMNTWLELTLFWKHQYTKHQTIRNKSNNKRIGFIETILKSFVKIQKSPNKEMTCLPVRLHHSDCTSPLNRLEIESKYS